VLDAVVVVVKVVDVVHVVVVQICSLKSLAATQVLFTAESVLVYAWLILFSVYWNFSWSAAERSDLGGC